MKSQSSDWQNIARTGAVLTISGLHWLTYYGGKTLLACADQLEGVKQWIEPTSQRLRKARR